MRTVSYLNYRLYFIYFNFEIIDSVQESEEILEEILEDTSVAYHISKITRTELLALLSEDIQSEDHSTLEVESDNGFWKPLKCVTSTFATFT